MCSDKAEIMSEQQNDKSRRLRFEIFRYNPQDEDSDPHTDVFEIEETPFMTLFIALNKIRETLDPGLQFDFACRSAICGSCGMLVNGRPALACRTLTSDLPEEITLYPLPAFKWSSARKPGYTSVCPSTPRPSRNA
jgi:fumarate reductase iron-sulfur subunit